MSGDFDYIYICFCWIVVISSLCYCVFRLNAEIMKPSSQTNQVRHNRNGKSNLTVGQDPFFVSNVYFTDSPVDQTMSSNQDNNPDTTVQCEALDYTCVSTHSNTCSEQPTTDYTESYSNTDCSYDCYSGD